MMKTRVVTAPDSITFNGEGSGIKLAGNVTGAWRRDMLIAAFFHHTTQRKFTRRVLAWQGKDKVTIQLFWDTWKLSVNQFKTDVEPHELQTLTCNET